MNKNMKSTRFFLYVALVPILSFSFAACDDFDEEIFEQYVTLTKNGWYENDYIISDNNTITITVPILVNGTSRNAMDVTAFIEKDPDTLAAYNFDKYKNQTLLYYTELNDEAYSFDRESYTIPSGEIQTVANVVVDLNKLENQYKEYVLPLKISSVTGYSLGPSPYVKALFLIKLKNRFSGKYEGLATVTDPRNNYTEANNTTFYATGLNSCFFYAGHITRNDMDRDDFIVNVNFSEDDVLEFSALNNALNFSLSTKDTLSVKREYAINPSDARYYQETTTIKWTYTFKNLRDPATIKETLTYSGAISKNQKVLKEDFPNVVILD